MGESPKFVVAGHDNRSALIRIVTVPVGEENKTRIELRASDSMACPHTWFAAAQMAMVHAIKQGRGMSLEERALNGLNPQIIDTNFYKMPEETRRSLRIPELHTGSGILMSSVESLKKDHDYLLASDGPFGENFDGVLEPYTKTILEADDLRERCRHVVGKAWVKAQSETPVALEMARNELMREANELKRAELRLLSSQHAPLVQLSANMAPGRPAHGRHAFFNSTIPDSVSGPDGATGQPTTLGAEGQFN